MPILCKDNIADLDLYVRNHIYEYLAFNDERVTDKQRRNHAGVSYKELATFRQSYDKTSATGQPSSSLYKSLEYLKSKSIFVEIKLGNEVVNLADSAVFKRIYDEAMMSSKINEMKSFSARRRSPLIRGMATMTGLSTFAITEFLDGPFNPKAVQVTLLLYAKFAKPLKFPPVDRINVQVCPGLIPETSTPS